MAVGYRIRLAFGVNPSAGEPAGEDWVDVSTDVRGFSVRSGRSQDLDRIEAATASIILDNSSGNYTPENSDGDYYPYVRPFVQADIQYAADGEAFPFVLGECRLGVESTTLIDDAGINGIFRGFVEAWPPTIYPVTGGHVEIQCVDYFRFFRTSKHSASYSQQTVGARIDQVLTNISNPFPTSIDSTGVTLAAATVSGNVLDYLKEIAELDGGLFYCRGDGTIVFSSSATIRASSSWTTPQCEIGDQAPEIGYRSIAITFDEQLLVNQIDGSLNSGTAVTQQEDSTSQDLYMLRNKDFGTTPLVTAAQLENRAAIELSLKSRPRLRIDDLTFELLDTDIDSETLTALRIEDRVTITRRPDVGSALTGDYLVQGMDHDRMPGSWKFTLRVSSAPTGFVLGDALLGIDTFL